MNEENRQSLLTTLLLGAIVVVLLGYVEWESWFESESFTLTQDIQPDLITYTVEQLTFNKKGEKHYLLKAEQMQQFLDDNRNLIIRPDLILFRNQQAAWKTSANEGNSDGTGDEIHLRGNVVIEQQGHTRPATLETDTLTISATTSHAFTDDRVVIRQPGVLIEAQGLEADLNDNKLKLKHQVTSTYEPEKS